MRLKHGSTSKLLLLLGLAQLAIALFGIVYALYPTSSVKTEDQGVGIILDKIRSNNPTTVSKSGTLNPPEPTELKVEDEPAYLNPREGLKPSLYVPASFGRIQSPDEQRIDKGDSHSSPLPVQQQTKHPVEIIKLTREKVDQGTPLNFTARFKGKNKCGKIEAYQWSTIKSQWRTVNNAKVIKGQGTEVVTVDTANTTPGFEIYVSLSSQGCFGEVQIPVEVGPTHKWIKGSIKNLGVDNLKKVKIFLQGPGVSQTALLRDRSGTFFFPGLPNGWYSLSVTLPEYQPYNKRFQIGPGDSRVELSPITLRLNPPPVIEPPKPEPSSSTTVPPPPPKIIEPPPATGEGQVTVKWPENLAREWRGTIRVVYTPPASGRPGFLKEGYVTLAAFKLVDLKGLKDLSGGRSEFKPLDTAGQEWSFNIEPEDSAGNTAECTVVAEIKLRHRQSGAEIPLDNPQVTVQTTSLSVGKRPLSLNQVYGGSAVFALTGIVTLGVGGLRKKELLNPPDKSAVKEQKAVCHFSAVMNQEVVVQHATRVEVTVSREELEKVSGVAQDVGASEVNVRRKLVIEAIPKAHLEIVGEDNFSIAPPKPGKPVKLSFDVLPTHPGEGELWLVVKQGQVSLVKLKLTPSIVETAGGGAQQASAKASAPEAAPLARPLYVLNIFERVNGTEVSFTYLLQMPSLETSRSYSPPIKGDCKQYVENLYKEIEARWESNRDEASAFAAELRAFGGQLFDELFPTKLQRILWEHQHEIKSIMVISDEPFIPWELVHLKDPDQPGMPREEKFLGQMGLVRWLEGEKMTWPPERLLVRDGHVRYVIPDYPDERYVLPETKKEAEFLRKKFKAVEVEPQPDPVRTLIEEPGTFDLLHFACHGAAEQNNISNGSLLLKGRVEKENYYPAHLTARVAGEFSRLQTADNRPMVVVNACQAGRAGYQLSGVGGFAQAFLKGGAGAFVGTLWSVGDSPARVFTETLYEQMLRGATLSEAAIEARTQARKKGTATWLAYVVYGHPHMKIRGCEDCDCIPRPGSAGWDACAPWPRDACPPGFHTHYLKTPGLNSLIRMRYNFRVRSSASV